VLAAATARTLDLEINCQDKIWKSNIQILDAVRRP